MKPVRLTGAGLTWIGLTILVAFAVVVGLGGYYAGRKPPASQSTSVDTSVLPTGAVTLAEQQTQTTSPPTTTISCSVLEGGRANPTTGRWECPALDVLKELRRLRARLAILERHEALDRAYRRHLHAEGLTDRIEHVRAR